MRSLYVTLLLLIALLTTMIVLTAMAPLPQTSFVKIDIEEVLTGCKPTALTLIHTCTTNRNEDIPVYHINNDPEPVINL